ncbi:hypothetical protein [Terrarubrum flagellatum]|uniref:hypothetical protein n=1 Tax=Terrirubrum flagellatum TaxID=2895980 RepID=UPI0031450DC0
MRALPSRLIIAGFAMTLSSLGSASGQTFDWEMRHRFRLIINEQDHDRLLAGLFSKNLHANVLADIFGVRRNDAAQQASFSVATAWDQSAAQYRSAWFHDQARRIRVRVRGTKAADLCEYQKDGGAILERKCGDWLDLDARLGSSAIKWRIRNKPDWTDANIEARDVKIASLGDSYSSGEGNPHSLFSVFSEQFGVGAAARWKDERCHRSLISGPAIGAMRLALADPHASVTFVSFACSGAEVDDGILSRYFGRESVFQVGRRYEDAHRSPPTVFQETKLQTQLSRLQALLCKDQPACAARETLDALIVGTGGNEVGFGAIVRLAYAGQIDRTRAAVRRRIDEEFRRLKPQFAELAQKITELAPRRTLLMTYLDPTKNEAGQPCRTTVAHPGLNPLLELFGVGAISASESDFAAKEVLFRLEDFHRSVAKEHGWAFVGDFSRRHGFCTQSSFFRSFNEAGALQGYLPRDDAAGVKFPFPTGVMHPNLYGHLHVSGRIYDALK